MHATNGITYISVLLSTLIKLLSLLLSYCRMRRFPLNNIIVFELAIYALVRRVLNNLLLVILLMLTMLMMRWAVTATALHFNNRT